MQKVISIIALLLFTGQIILAQNVGINTDLPTTDLDVDGQIRMRDGSTSGFLLVSDAEGNMTWTDPLIAAPDTQQLGISNNLLSISNGNSIRLTQVASIDGNTKIDAEETLGTNIIRMDAGGIEMLTLTTARMGLRDFSPSYTLDMNHGDGAPSTGSNGLNIQNESNGNHWTLYTGASDFTLYRNENLRGTFDGTNGMYTSTSDLRLKKNVQNLDAQMSKIMMLTPSIYQFKSQADDRQHFGLIAQEVRSIYPELAPVIEASETSEQEDLLGVTYSAFIPVLIAGMQEQQGQIIQLENENKILKEQLEAILQRVEQLEK